MALKTQLCSSCLNSHCNVQCLNGSLGGGQTADRRCMYCDTILLCSSVLIRLELHSEWSQKKVLATSSDNQVDKMSLSMYAANILLCKGAMKRQFSINHCRKLEKYHLWRIEHLRLYSNVCFVYYILNNREH